MRWNPGQLWRWLRAPKNRTVLGWLGGGLMILAGGAWTLITHFDKSNPTSSTQAHQGSVAITGSPNTGGGGISASYTGTTPPSTSSPAAKPPAEEAKPNATGVPKPGR